MPSKGPPPPPPRSKAQRLDAIVKGIKVWMHAKEELDMCKAHERDTRAFVIAQCFPSLKEGVNTTEVDQFVIKATKKLKYEVSDVMLNTYAGVLREAGINVESLIRTSPELKLKAYRELNDAKRKQFDRVLTISDATTSLDVETV